VSPVLVGRQKETAALTDALASVASGESATVLVSGEAGVGKSRLVHELIRQAAATGTQALVGSCAELDGGGIRSPLVDMFPHAGAQLVG
jgi:predicted ATPase